ncbi:hypothetical protein NXS19_003054 [Fusarium pseudograminearum]|nr:hypothetical protein NXS19_003054 [Fusarium pseudograminearum]
MALSRGQALSTYVSGIKMSPGTSPASVVFRNTLYIFYAGSSSDGIWYTSTADGVNWAPVINVNKKGAGALNMAEGTSPSAVVFRDALYLLYNPAAGYFTSFTKFDGSSWSAVATTNLTAAGLGYRPKTSPSAVVYRDILYSFHCADYEFDVILQWNSFNGIKWNASNGNQSFYVGPRGSRAGPLDPVLVAPGTSPSGLVYDDELYCYFTGMGNTGTCYVTVQEGKILAPVSLSKLNTGMPFQPQISPIPLVLLEIYAVRWFWVEKASQTLWYSDYRSDGGDWSPLKKLSCDGDVPKLAINTNITAVQFLNKPYILWNSGTGISFCAGFVWEISDTTSAKPTQLLRESDSFTVSTSDSTLVTFLQSELGNGPTAREFIPVSPRPATVTGEIFFVCPRPAEVVSDFTKSVYSKFDVTSSTPLATKISITTTLLANAFKLSYIIILQFQQQKVTLRFYRYRR